MMISIVRKRYLQVGILTEVYKRFPTQADCIKYLETVKWQGAPICPYCGGIKSSPMPKEHRHHCNDCNTSYSVTVGTIFHKTKIDLQRWFLAVTLILNAKKGISARQLARDLDVNKNTAWYMAMRIRKSMIQQRQLLQGIVEMDECYIGGKPRKGKKNDDGPPKRGRGTKKTPVVGMAERGGSVTAKVATKKQLKGKSLSDLVRWSVDTQNSVLITDEYKGYLGIKRFMPHKVINHQVWYVDGDIHTNTIEGFWALLKRGIVGQFHKVSIRHLPKYLDEFCFRYNHRNDSDMWALAIANAVKP